MHTFQELISTHEDWLVDRTLQYAKRHGYTRYSSTLLEAWRQSVAGLSFVLIQALADPAYRPELDADADYSADPMTAFGVAQARKHRSRGIGLPMFLALLKFYRHSYLDLIAEHVSDHAKARSYSDFALKMFDKIELGCSSEWGDVSFTEEIGALQRQNQALTEQKLIYLTIFETLKDPVVFADDTGRIVNMNRSACLCFTQYGTPGAIYYGQTDIDKTELLFKPFFEFESNEADFPDCQLPTSTGLCRFHIKARRMIDSSERMKGIVLICTDITDYRRALQDAAQADRAKSAFLATMSHELRTPAAGILGASELLGYTGLSPSQRRYLDLIEASGSTLLSVLNEILDYSKFEEVGVVPLKENFDLHSVISDVVRIMRYQALRKSIRLDVSLAAGIPKRLHGDANKLSHILMNLIGNAVKFTDHGSIELSVRAIGAASGKKMTLEFSIVDTGIGFAPEMAEKLFKPFTQADDTISRKFGGTGLGLAICKRIVDALGGEIGAESQVNKGSTFWFRLPFQKAEAPGKASEAPADRPSAPLSILMVEDNDVNQIVGISILSHLGHKAELAGDGSEALIMLREKDYDVVLLDVHLPGMNGYEVARAIRSIGIPHKEKIPIVALTADGSATTKEAAAAAGMSGFLMKPLRSEDLRRALAAPEFKNRAALREDRSVPLVDETILRGHATELGLQAVIGIVSAFRSSATSFEAEVSEALRSAETERIAFAVHKLKGAASNLGLVRLTGLADALEKGLPVASPAAMKLEIDLLSRCLRKSLSAVDTALRKFPTSRVPRTRNRHHVPSE